MAKPRAVELGIVHVQRRDDSSIVETLVPVISRTADVSEGESDWRITEDNGDRHWYPKDSLLGLVVRSPESSAKHTEKEEADGQSAEH